MAKKNTIDIYGSIPEIWIFMIFIKSFLTEYFEEYKIKNTCYYV